MQPFVEQGPRPRQLARADQRDDESVLDDLALGMAAADAHDLVQHGLQRCDAGRIVLAGEGIAARGRVFGTTGPAGNLPSASRCSIAASRSSSAARLPVAAASSAMCISTKGRLIFGK